jgi:predicted DNA-binding transcriptional regulator AlpA
MNEIYREELKKWFEKNLSDEPLLTVEELAKELKIKQSWIYGKTRTGDIPTIEVDFE